MKTFKDRVVALTGASSGIGLALAEELAARGAHLALCDVDEVGLARTQDLCEKRGARVFCTRVDVSDQAAVEQWARDVIAHYGVCHAIFNNAGIAIHGTVEEVPLEVFERVMEVNFWGVVHGSRAFLPYLKKAQEGHVVNLSSIFGIVGVPGQSAYNASKFAVRGFSEALHQELTLLAPHVHCTCVHPGGIKTNIARAASFIGQQLGATDATRLSRRFDKMARTTPERAAQIILRAVLRDQPRVLVGEDALLLDLAQRLVPAHYHPLLSGSYKRILEREKTGARK